MRKVALSLLVLLLSQFMSAQVISGRHRKVFAAAGGGITILGAGQGEQHSAAASTSVVTGTGTGSSAFSCAAGNAAMVFFGFSTATVASAVASDSAANSGWTIYPGTLHNNTKMFYNLNLTSPVTSATVTYTSTAMGTWVGAVCFSGATGHVDFNQAFLSSSAGGTPYVSQSFTTFSANELVCSFQDNGNSVGMASATAPGVLELNFTNAISPYFFPTVSVICASYSSIQTGVTQAGTYTGANANYASLTGGIY